MPSGAQPGACVLGRGDRVRVLLTWPRLPHAGETGTVRKVWLDGGELAIRVTFADGTEEVYNEHELEDLRSQMWGTRNQATHGD